MRLVSDFLHYNSKCRLVVCLDSMCIHGSVSGLLTTSRNIPVPEVWWTWRYPVMVIFRAVAIFYVGISWSKIYSRRNRCKHLDMQQSERADFFCEWAYSFMHVLPLGSTGGARKWPNVGFTKLTSNHQSRWAFDLDRRRLGGVSPYSASPAVDAGGRGGVVPAGLLSAGSTPPGACGAAHLCWQR